MATSKKTEEAVEETPKKRRPGRPRMTPEQKAAAAAARKAAKEAAAREAAEAAAKEAADKTEAKGAKAAPAEEAPKKRRPGRPRMTPEQKAAAAAARKAAKEAAAREAAQSSVLPLSGGADEAEQGSASIEGVKTAPAEEAPKKRRPGRPRKADVEAAAKEAAQSSVLPPSGGADEAEQGSASTEGVKATPADSAASDSTPVDDEHDADARHSRRRGRRNKRNGNRREIVPSATRDELAALADDELVAKAISLEVDPTEYGESDDLVTAVYNALLQSEGFVQIEGILDLLPDGYGFIRTEGYLPSEHDVYVHSSMIRRNGLRRGDYISGRVRPPRENEKYPALNSISELNDEPFDGPKHRVKFGQLTPVYPDERLVMEHGAKTITARAIDLVSPIGKGQRGLIVSPPKAGKTTVLKDIAAAITANNPEVHLMCLLVDERPEEVTDMERSIEGEVVSSTFDMPCENHIAVSELVIERAKRLVENGQDVVILLDSITRLARAYNLGQPASGRILSGGVDSTALYPPKRFLGAARNIENGGSLTILGTALIDTGSKMDEVIFEEFKGTGNMELKLDRQLADKRIFPAIDPVTSGTRKEELLIDPQEAPLIWGVRRLLANMNNTERAMDMLIKSLKQTETNTEFLIKSARKASKSNITNL